MLGVAKYPQFGFAKPTIQDDLGHGSAIAQVLLNRLYNDAARISEVDPLKIEIEPVRVFSAFQASPDELSIAQAIEHANKLRQAYLDGTGTQNVRVVNLSAGAKNNAIPTPELKAAIENARRLGILVVVPGGGRICIAGIVIEILR